MTRFFFGLGFVCALATAQESNPSGWVVLPVRDYDQLRGKAQPPVLAPMGPPLDAVLTRVDYQLQAQSGAMTGTAKLTVDVFREGWAKAAAPTDLFIEEARLAGKPASMVNGMILLPHKGRHEVTLRIAVPVITAAGQDRVTLPVGESGITSARITVGREDFEAVAAGGFLQMENGVWTAYANGGAPLRISWKRKAPDPSESLAPQWRGRLAQWTGLGEDSSAVNAEVEVDVTQGGVRQVKVKVPDPVLVNDVRGALIGNWEAANGELTVQFLNPVDSKAQFLIQAEAKLPREGTIQVPLLELIGAAQESGGVAVEALGTAELKATRPNGLEPVEAADLGAAIAARQNPAMAAFRFRPVNPRGLVVDVARYTPQAVLTAVADEARILALATKSGKTLVQARYAIRNNQRNFARVQLPEGAILWEMRVEGRAVRPGRAPDGALVAPLARPRGSGESAAFSLEILYLAPGATWTERGAAFVPLPALDLPVARSGLVFHYPPLYRVTPAAGAFRVQEYEDPRNPALTAPSASVAAIARPENSLDIARNQIGQTAEARQNSQMLVDRFRSSVSRRPRSTSVPTQFPARGPRLFLTAELTAEGQASRIEFAYQAEKKGGSQ